MLYLLLLLIIGVIVIGGFKRKRGQRFGNHKVEQCVYPDISQREFAILAKQAARKIKRVSSLTVRDANVYGEVTSQSGISTWDFSLDFGEIGRLTGDWRKYSGNWDSDIPEIVANSISEASISAGPILRCSSCRQYMNYLLWEKL